MAIELDHTIVPSRNKEKAARFFARIFGLAYEDPWGRFSPVKINDSLTFDFDDDDDFEPHHYAFRVDRRTFAEILGRVEAEKIEFGDGPSSRNMKISDESGTKRFYFYDLDGHNLEVITTDAP